MCRVGQVDLFMEIYLLNFTHPIQRMLMLMQIIATKVTPVTIVTFLSHSFQTIFHNPPLRRVFIPTLSLPPTVQCTP